VQQLATPQSPEYNANHGGSAGLCSHHEGICGKRFCQSVDGNILDFRTRAIVMNKRLING
jgi:hypothetical protein